MTTIDSQVHIWKAATAERPHIKEDASKPHRSIPLTSCLPCYVDEPYPFPTLHPQIRRAVEAFGPARFFWGTDLSQLPCPYRQPVTLFTEELDFLSVPDKEWIMGRALSKWLNWPLSGESEAQHQKSSR